MKDDEVRQILDRLDTLIAIQLTMITGSQLSSVKDRVLLLADLGMAPGEIGKLVGRKANYVSAVIGNKKKAGKSDV